MPNTIDFVREYGGVPVSDRPVGDVDLLIFAQLAQLPFRPVCVHSGLPGISLSDALRALRESREQVWDKKFAWQLRDERALASALESSERYRHMRLVAFDRIRSLHPAEQFAALAILPGDGTVVIAYAGTDDTILGWKESLSLSYMNPIPSQADAAVFAHQLADAVDLPMKLVGHSKGGNLAVYTASRLLCAYQARVAAVLSFDGPGMHPDLTETRGYRRIEDRLRVIAPRSSVIGMLFTQLEEIEWVESSAMGMQQHYPYSWQVTDGEFVFARRQSLPGAHLADSLQEFVNDLTVDQRRRLVEALFEILASTNVHTFPDLMDDLFGNLRKIISSIVQGDAAFTETLLTGVKWFLRALFRGRASARRAEKHAARSFSRKGTKAGSADF